MEPKIKRKRSVPFSVKCLVERMRARRKILNREVIQTKMIQAITRINAMEVEIETLGDLIKKYITNGLNSACLSQNLHSKHYH